MSVAVTVPPCLITRRTMRLEPDAAAAIASGSFCGDVNETLAHHTGALVPGRFHRYVAAPLTGAGSALLTRYGETMETSPP
jgi:hypothetical protein